MRSIPTTSQTKTQIAAKPIESIRTTRLAAAQIQLAVKSAPG